jgi:hypothetical protein
MSKSFTQANLQFAFLACVWISLAIYASWNGSRASAQGSAPASNSEITIIDVAATLREQRGVGLSAFLYAPVELEALEAGKTYRLRIKVLNPSEVPIRFKEFSATCGCAKVTAEDNQIAAFGSGQVQMDLKVPSPANGSQAATRVQVSASFTSPDPTDVGFKVIVTYEVSNSFCFGTDRVEIEIPEKESVVVTKVPVVITAPLTIDKLELITTENLRDFSAKLVHDNDSDVPHSYVELKIPRVSVGRSGVVGELILKRPDTDQVAGMMVRVRHQENVAIRPESIRLSRDNDSKAYMATAVLRVGLAPDAVSADKNNPPTQDDKGSNIEKPSMPAMPEVALSINGIPAKVEVKQIGGGGFYRVTVRFDGTLDVGADDTLEVRWRILYDGRESVIQSHAFVPAVQR